MMRRTWRTEGRWLNEPDISAWVAQSRLNLMGALPDHAAQPSVQTALTRYLTHVKAAIEQLERLEGSSSSRGTGAAESARDLEVQTYRDFTGRATARSHESLAAKRALDRGESGGTPL